MNWLMANRRVAVVIGLTLALPLALLLYGVISFWSLGHSYQSEIDGLEPRIARLLGVREAQEQLLATASSANTSLQDLVYPAEGADSVSATLQKNVRGIMSGAGLVVDDSQIVAARREGAFDVIGLVVSVTGGIDALDAALADIASHAPLLLVNEISVTPARTSRRKNAGGEQQVLSVKMNLMALVSIE